MESIPKFIITGKTPKERGISYGSQCRELINGTVGRYKEWFSTGHGSVDWETVKKISEGFVDNIKKFAPDLLDELIGIAEGAGCDFLDILAVNSRSEAFTLVGKESSEGDKDGCSSALVLPEASADKHTILAQNWDLYEWIGKGAVVLELIRDDGPDVMIVTEAGQLARYGVNQAGIALAVNGLHVVKNTELKGVPSTVIRRKFIMQDRWIDAINTMFATEYMVPLYYCGAYAGGDSIGFEATPKGIMTLYPENGILVHSNHILHPNWTYQREGLGGTLYRNRRIEKHLKPRIGQITMEDVKNAFSDHFGYPQSVCRHGDPRKTELERINTLACVLMDVEEKRLWACKGNPCCGEFVEYSWTRPERLANWEDIVRW